MAWENNEISQVFSKEEYNTIKFLIINLVQFTQKAKYRGQEKENGCIVQMLQESINGLIDYVSEQPLNCTIMEVLKNNWE